MPAAGEQPAAKKEREELLWQSLKEHIMRERQKIKEEQEAEVEEERLRKEREERDRQDAMTLGETKEQIHLLNTRLEDLKNEKQQLFLRLKKVLNEDENRKKQQQQKDSEMYAFTQSLAQQQGSHPQIFLPPRAPHLQMPKVAYMQSGPPPMSGIATPPNKRVRSPSPTPQYYKPNNPSYSQGQKHEDGRRGGEIARTVLWNKPSYQNPPGTLYYPSNTQDSRPPIVYPAYAPNLNIPMISPYHPELSQQQAQPQQMSAEQAQQSVHSHSQSVQQSSQGSNQQPSSQPTNMTHETKAKSLHGAPQHSSQSQKIQQSSHGGQLPHSDRGYQQQQVQQHQQQQNSQHLVQENMYRIPMSLPSGMMTISPQNQQAMQNMKPTGSITQGYPNRVPTNAQQAAAQQHAAQQAQQQAQQQQHHQQQQQQQHQQQQQQHQQQQQQHQQQQQQHQQQQQQHYRRY